MTFPESFLMKNSDANPKVSVLNRAENDVGFYASATSRFYLQSPCFCNRVRLPNNQV